jgi:hypothetical protein
MNLVARRIRSRKDTSVWNGKRQQATLQILAHSTFSNIRLKRANSLDM